MARGRVLVLALIVAVWCASCFVGLRYFRDRDRVELGDGVVHIQRFWLDRVVRECTDPPGFSVQNRQTDSRALNQRLGVVAPFAFIRNSCWDVVVPLWLICAVAAGMLMQLGWLRRCLRDRSPGLGVASSLLFWIAVANVASWSAPAMYVDRPRRLVISIRDGEILIGSERNSQSVTHPVNWAMDEGATSSITIVPASRHSCWQRPGKYALYDRSLWFPDMSVIAIPGWPMLAGLGFMILFFWGLRVLRSAPAGHCEACGYDLTGNESGVCSECGAEIAKSSSTELIGDRTGGRHVG